MVESFLARFKGKFKEKKRLYTAILLIALGLMLVAFSAVSSSENEGSGGAGLAEYKAELEERLAELCSSVRGVGKCKVMITFERGEENTYKGSSLIESKPPKVMGVSVICRGADSDDVRRELTTMISALFDIGSNRRSVLKLHS